MRLPNQRSPGIRNWAQPRWLKHHSRPVRSAAVFQGGTPCDVAHHNKTMSFASIPEAIEDFRSGRILIVIDDEDRENEGDLTVAADKVTPEIINFMATHRPRPYLSGACPGYMRAIGSAADVGGEHSAIRHRFL